MDLVNKHEYFIWVEMSERFFCRKEGKCSTYGDWGKFHRLWFFFLYSPWNSPGQNTGVVSRSLLQGIFQPRAHTQVSRIAGDSVPAEPLGKPKNTGVGSLSLLQGIFLTQELNWGLIYCRRSLYSWATWEALMSPSWCVFEKQKMIWILSRETTGN